jgi:hypothetical protein
VGNELSTLDTPSVSFAVAGEPAIDGDGSNVFGWLHGFGHERTMERMRRDVRFSDLAESNTDW